MATEKILVNGKVMSQEEYLKLATQYKEAQKAYKDTPAFKKEQEAKKELSSKRAELVQKFIAYGEKLGLDKNSIANIGYSVYNEIKRKPKANE